MQQKMQLLTTSEAADYLRIGERKLYDLVAAGAIPCTKVTGRWLFPKAELDHWLAAGLVRPDGARGPEPQAIVGGSHDPMLEWALRDSGTGLATLSEGSERGLERFSAGEVVAAAIHLHAIDPAVDANVAAMQAGGLHDVVLVNFLRREQGLLVAPGNPMKLASLADALAAHARFAQRPKGAGAQLLLVALLHREDHAQKLVAGPNCPTGPDVAQAIRSGHADCGIATRAVANLAGLGFVPVMWETFDLVMRQRDYFRAPLQNLLEFMRTPPFANRARELGGYDTSASASVRFAA
jgi:excisionase family DNA binding protein